MPRRFLAACTLALLLIAVPSQALAAVRITRVQYDSPGTDTGGNSSLNGEWVRITNNGNSAKMLTGWTLRDNSGHVYRFGTYKLRADSTVKIHTGSGDNTRGHRYWDNGAHVWNNTGDRATLKNASGTVIDRCDWGDGSGVTAC